MKHCQTLRRSFGLLLCAVAFALVTEAAAGDKPLPGAGKAVFVQNFELDAQDFQGDSSLVSKLPEGPLPRPHLIRGKKEDAATQAKKLVDSMSNDLVKDLQKQGFTANRLMPGDPKPSQGWLLEGVFTEVDEGNRVHRAVVGFGSGAAKMSLYVHVTDLTKPGPALYEFADKGTSGKRPGAVITLSPIAAGAKFALEKNAPEKTVKKTASQIVAELVKQMNAPAAAK